MTLPLGGPPESPRGRWERYRKAVRDEPLPLGLVDLDAFDRNVEQFSRLLRGSGKRLRIATKSIRCPDLTLRALARLGPEAAGLMTYSASETLFWAQRGARDLLLAYPTVQPSDLKSLAAAGATGATAAVVVDSVEHLAALEGAGGAAGATMPFVVELDVASHRFGLHLGVRRSPLQAPEDVLGLLERAAGFKHLRFHGLMAYEAQIAGVTDAGPFSSWANPAKRLMKLDSKRTVAALRSDVVRALTARGFAPKLVNGGGTGSAGWAAEEPALTEITVGSGFMGSHLFDYYRDLAVEPAAYFALQVTRRPGRGWITCQGGGWIASGQAGPDRLPVPALPEGLSLLPLEGAGEVQTPLALPADCALAPGDPVFFRHAKAGELAEHVKEYVLVRGDAIEQRAATYRGLGQCF